jgi:hypothetical protein
MRRRFILSVLISDLVALGAALLVASALTFEGGILPWQAARADQNVWPMLGLLTGGAVLGS